MVVLDTDNQRVCLLAKLYDMSLQHVHVNLLDVSSISRVAFGCVPDEPNDAAPP